MLALRIRLLFWGALGCGCGATLEPIEVGPGCPDAPLREPQRWAGADESLLIDDFEDLDDHLRRSAGRDGAWILGSDMTGPEPTAESSARCAARGQGVGHFASRGLTDWGTNWTAVLRRSPGGAAAAYDASAYQAVSFWAAVSAESDQLSLPVGVTTLDVAWNGGICSVCMDFYRTRVTLTSTWQRFVVPFGALEQAGNGVPQAPLRLDRLVGFILWPEGDFELWLDDVRFEPTAQ
jgi:hypothetical protein